MTHDDTNSSSLTLEALLAAQAARTSVENERDLAYAVAADLGLHAQQLADDYLAHGDLTNARRWYRVAVHYDIPGAADALNDVETLIEVSDSVWGQLECEDANSTEDRHGGSTADTEDTADSDVAQITVLDGLAAAASLVRRAQEHAAQVENRTRAILDDAREQADRIVTSARHEAERIVRAAADAHGAFRLADLLAKQGGVDELTARADTGVVQAAHRLTELLAHEAAVVAARSLPDYQREPGTDRLQPSPQLNTRELQVLRGMAAGKSNQQIGLELSLSVETVKAHAYRLFRKLGVRKRAQVVGREPCAGLISFVDEQADLRLVTGGGGQGKTRLAPALAEDALPCHKLWSWLVAHYEEIGHGHGDLSPANILLPSHDGRLWTPATTAADWVIGDHGSVSQFYAANTPNIEQRPERERIVAGPKLRQAIDELKEQLATTGA